MRRACWKAAALTAWLALPLAAHAQRPPDAGPAPIATRQNVFAIPFRVDNNSGGKAALEVQLHVSVNAGATWQLAGKVAPSAGRFKFTAPHDGQYWFMVRTLDKQGMLRPTGPAVAELKVVVDTAGPVLELQAQRGNAGELRAQWRVRDAFLRPDSLRLAYRASGSSDAWQAVAVDPLKPDGASPGTYTGEATWWPNTAAAGVTIRVEATDLAGNTTSSQARLERMPGHLASTQSGAGSASQIQPLPPTDGPGSPAESGGSPFPITALPPVVDSPSAEAPLAPYVPPSSAPPPIEREHSVVPWPSQKMAEPLVQAEAPAALPQMPSTFPKTPGPTEQVPVPQPTAQVLPPGRLAAARPQARASARVSTPAEAVLPPPAVAVEAPQPIIKPDPPREPESTPPPVAQVAEPAQPPVQSAPPIQPAPPVARQSASAAGPALGNRQETAAQQQVATAPSPMLPPGVRPRMVNSRRFELGYDVDSIGSDGISKIELWGTRDGGRNWQCFGTDNDTRSPFPVAVDGEGLYGFRMIVETTGGLRGVPPQAGDLAEIWVGVDTAKPSAKLLNVEPRPAVKTTEVVVRWEADDQLLAARPITLLFSSAPTGPWAVLASGLENTGEYHWRIDARIPDRIYLRLEVRDEAGNTRAAETPEPITIDRIRPQGRILDVRPIGEARQRPPTHLR